MENINKYLLIIFAFLSFQANSQEIKAMVFGEVIAEDGNPVIGAIIKQVDGDKSAVSDQTGKFEFTFSQAGMYKFEISSFGFETIVKELEAKPNTIYVHHLVVKYQDHVMPQITIYEKKNGALDKIPGSITVINEAEIKAIDPISGNEVLRRTPGVHVVDEEGVGLRANIGIRGMDPDRSRGVLVLEDGIPVALNPYGEPEMYYTPAMDRMVGVEILKGSGSILFGPQTIGGVVNYITADPPATEQGSVSIKGAAGGYFNGMVNYGNTFGKTGVQVNFLHKQVDDLGIINFNVTDFNTKLKFQTSAKSVVGVKFGIYNESSNATYIGMTTPMFQSGQHDFTRIAPNDLLLVRRYSLSATHSYFFNKTTNLKTTAFAYTTTRNWRRQDFATNSFDSNGNLNPPPSDFTGVKYGDESIAGGAIYLRNRTANRDRQFEVMGVETRFNKQFKLFGINNDFIIGGRFMSERAFEQRINGTKPDAVSGALVNEEVRYGYGSSAFIHNRFDIHKKFSLTAGTRFEYYDFTRNILRNSFTIDGVTSIKDTSIVGNSSIAQIIPGVGFTFVPSEKMVVFGGAHRGFAPPRLKDAISNDGEDYQLEAELSWNYELGTRLNIAKGINIEATAFYMDFSNQAIPVSQSSGGSGSGLVNGGRTTHIGAEAGVWIMFDKIFDMKEKISANVNFTFVEAKFSDDRFIGSDAVNINGNYTPYAPKMFINSGIRYNSQYGFGVQLTHTYVGEQYTDLLNTVEASTNGTIGLIPAYQILDGGANYKWEKINTTFSITAKNILNERYMVTRRPQGIRVGIPRYVIFGVKYEF